MTAGELPQPILTPCEGGGCPPIPVTSLCQMCGTLLLLGEDGRIIQHDRKDILAMLARGDFG